MNIIPQPWPRATSPTDLPFGGNAPLGALTLVPIAIPSIYMAVGDSHLL